MRRFLLAAMAVFVLVILFSTDSAITGRVVEEVSSPLFSGVILVLTFLMVVVVILRVLKA